MALTFGNYNRSSAAKMAGTGGTKYRAGINVMGLKELQQFMDFLPKQLNNKKNLIKIFRFNSKPLQKKIKSNLASMTFKKGTSGSSQLEKSVGFFTTKESRKVGGGYVGLRVRGAYKNKEKSGYYGAWIELGNEAKKKTYKWGPARPFIKPAFEETKRIMMDNLLHDARKVMYKETKKLVKFGTLGYS